MDYRNQVVQEDLGKITESGIPVEKLKEKCVLVTGANGMLATYLVYYLMHLNEKGDGPVKVIALARNEKKAQERFGVFGGNPCFRLLIQDVCDSICPEEKVDYIVHAAGGASPQAILNDPVGIIRANTQGTVNVLELARRDGAKVLYTSTREVYGKMDESVTEIREEDFGFLDPMERRSCYPESKRIAESLIQSYYYQYGVESAVARIAHSYGPGMNIDHDGRVMADFISDVVGKRNIVLKSTGDAVRAFCYITDAISAMLYVLLEGKNNEAYNIANETEPVPIREAAQTLVSLFPERGLSVVFDIPKEMSLGYSKMGRVALSTGKLEGLGWRPMVSLAEGMRRTVVSFG